MTAPDLNALSDDEIIALIRKAHPGETVASVLAEFDYDEDGYGGVLNALTSIPPRPVGPCETSRRLNVLADEMYGGAL